MLFMAIFSIMSLDMISPAQAAGHDLCICQTGSKPANQVAFFKAGCKLWNLAQKCSKKITISVEDSIENILSKRPKVRTVKLGYVGHWGSSTEAAIFLKDKILPSIKKFDTYFSINNTACLSTENPYEILNFLKSIGKYASHIDFKGNQAVSTGIWDSVMPGKNNFWANINGSSLTVTFPHCKEYENKLCAKMFQKNEQGICYDDRLDQHVFLKCKETIRKTMVANNPGSRAGGYSEVSRKVHEWKRLMPEMSYKGADGYPRLITMGVEESDEHDFSLFLFKDDQRIHKIVAEKIKKAEEKIKRKLVLKKEDTSYVIDKNDLLLAHVKDESEANLYMNKINEDVRNSLIFRARQY